MEVDGAPVARVLPPDFRLRTVDLSASARDEAVAAADGVLGELFAAPFDLERGPVFRAALVRVANDEHRFGFSVHHIVSDGWSLGILFSELASLYAAYARGEASPLPELAVQYGDYAAWQRGWIRGEVLARQLSYWSGVLKGVPPLLARNVLGLVLRARRGAGGRAPHELPEPRAHARERRRPPRPR